MCIRDRMIIQGVWANESPLFNVPHFSESMISILREKEKITYLCELVQAYKEKRLRSILKKYRFDLDEDQLKEIEEMIDTIPDVSFRAQLLPFDSDQMQPIEPKEGQDHRHLLKETGEAVVRVHLKRENSHQPVKVQMKRFQKVKDASWWIVIGDQKENKLICMKRIFLKNTLKKDIQIELPEDFTKTPKLQVFFVSDSYIGIDQINNVWLKKEN
eukprot:TRINITY_DN29251_c0_g1_i2.p1 TRINITY_DN29251_c0_g1~~TRINITY_DN29251_c0_g1_i2.p1  ORF type:complete len:248 (+),score=71.72 TRINITY_DN29251_c0_g1_i2:101-745(+)